MSNNHVTTDTPAASAIGPPSVDSEVGTLRTVLIHTPDDGVGAVIPKKATEWLYEDIVHLETMQAEFDIYKQILLAFLDVRALLQWFGHEAPDHRLCATPGSVDYVDSPHVVDIETILVDVLRQSYARMELVSSVCALEGCNYPTQEALLRVDAPEALARILITGATESGGNGSSGYIFPPIPNFIFTRDLGAVINDRVVLSRLFKRARTRESMRYCQISLMAP